MSNNMATQTPMSDHVVRFWKHLEIDTVRILLDLKRVAGEGGPDGPSIYWDGSTFSDEVAKALVAERAAMADALKWAFPLADMQLENHRLERIKNGHTKAPFEYKSSFGTPWIGLTQEEWDARERAKAAKDGCDALQKNNEIEQLRKDNELMRSTLEIIAARSADLLQATQAKGALTNIGHAVT